MDKISKSNPRPTTTEKTWLEDCTRLQRIFESNLSITELKVGLPFVYVKTFQDKMNEHNKLQERICSGGKWMTLTERGITANDLNTTMAYLIFNRQDTASIFFEITLPHIHHYQAPEDITPFLNMLYVEPRDDRTILQYRIATTDQLTKRLKEFQEMSNIFFRVHCCENFSPSVNRSAFIY